MAARRHRGTRLTRPFFGVASLLLALVACSGGSQKAETFTTSSVSATSTSSSTSAAPGSSSTTSVTAQRTSGTLAGKTVVIDPGHNGGNASHSAEINRLVDVITQKKACDTTGTVTNSGYAEWAYTLDVSQRLATLLEAAGAHVVLTRTTNTGVGPCITERAAIGNTAKADAAVSIHADGGPPGGRGFHVIEPALVRGHTEPILAPSHQLALHLRSAYISGTGMPYSTYIGKDGLDVRNDLGGLNLSTVPKVFIETGNMRNATDAALLTSPDFRQKAAQALFKGLEQYLT